MCSIAVCFLAWLICGNDAAPAAAKVKKSRLFIYLFYPPLNTLPLHVVPRHNHKPRTTPTENYAFCANCFRLWHIRLIPVFQITFRYNHNKP